MLVSMSRKADLIRCLHFLKNADYTDAVNAQKSDGEAEDALNFLYQVCLKRTEFTDEEKIILGNLLATAIVPIQINIEGTDCTYRTRLENSVLMKRSALQFLIDDFGQFPVGDSTLIKVLQDNNIDESIEILDEIIDNFRDSYDSDEGFSDREEAGSKKVPSSHTWWSV